MFFRAFWVPGLAQACYMVGMRGGPVAVIDPLRDMDRYLEVAREEDVTITAVMDTHIHADYLSGARELAARTGASLYLSAEGGPDWQYQFEHIPLRDGDTMDIGQYRITAVHTPGHTPEHLMYLVADTKRSLEPWMAFTGDFLFVGDVGRPDLLGEATARGLAERLYESIQTKLLPLPDGLEIYPNHGEGSLCGRNLGSKSSTTLGYERRFNYALQPMSQAAFVRKILEGQPPAPPYFRRMKQINKEGAKLLGGLPQPRPLSPQQFRAETEKGALVVDARSKESFAGAHIPNAYSNPLDKFFATWAGYILPPDQLILLVLGSPGEWEMVVRQLLRVGYDGIQGFLDGGMAAWEQAGYPIASLPQLPAQQLRRKLEEGEKILVLDVRTGSEWMAERFPYAIHMHAGHLPDRWEELEKDWGASKDTPIVVLCRSGHRATIAASILQQKGFTNVFNVPGGMMAWREVGGLVCREVGCPDYKPWQPWWQDTVEPSIQVTAEIAVGPQPTEQGLEAIAAKGYRTVINLRDLQEASPLPFRREKEKVEELGMEYLHCPMTPENIQNETVAGFLALLGRAGSGPVFVHCSTGHRAAVVVLLHLAQEAGWTLPQVLEKARSLGFDLDSRPRLKESVADYLTRSVIKS